VEEVRAHFAGASSAIPASDIHKKVADILDQKDLFDEKRRFRLSRKIEQNEKPLVILLGGTSGIGKSTIAAALTRRLGIERVIGTDEVREVMRYMLPQDLVPTLHQSSYDAGEVLSGPEFPENLLVGFSRQASLVNRGVHAYIKRIEKEGLKAIFNGVHLVPGILDLDKYQSVQFFHYILTLENKEEHIRRFHFRAKGSYRDAERYIDRIDRIRDIQNYYIEQNHQSDSTRIENHDINNTVTKIIDDLIQKLQEAEFDEQI
jgi:2-phosphoglycerate kinase